MGKFSVLTLWLRSDRTEKISIPPVTRLVVNSPAFLGEIAPDSGKIAAVALGKIDYLLSL